MNYTKQLAGIGGLLSLGFGAMTMWKSAIFYGKSLFVRNQANRRFLWSVEPGHRAFKFNKFSGVQDNIMREGWHFKMPYFER